MNKLVALLQILLVFSACTNDIVPVKVESVIFDNEELTITEGEKKALIATVLPENAENQTVYWSSNKNEVATVDGGIVTAISPGTAIITAISDEGGKKALCVVTVIEKPIPVIGVSLDKKNARVFLNDHLTLVAIIQPDDATNKALIWKSDDDSIAAVRDGVVTGVELGRTSVWVETEDGGFKAECVIDVVEERQTQSKGPITLDLGKVTATTAVLSGVLDIDQTADFDMTGGGVGFIYAKQGVELTVDTAEKVQITNVDYANGFSKTLTGLLRDTEYQYTIYLYKNNICQYGKTQTFRTKDAVITVDDITTTPTTVTLSGKVEREECDENVKVGIQYTKDEDFSNSATKSFDIVPENGVYSKTLEKLDINTTYYYRTYTRQNSVYKYGEKATFTTNAVDVKIAIGSKTRTSATIIGKIQPKSALEEVKVAIIANNSETVNKNNYTNIRVLKSSDIDDNGAFSITLNVLPGETYHYRYYILSNNVYSYGEIQTFTTEEINVTVDVENITFTTAEFVGNADLQESDTVEVGILCSSSISGLDALTCWENKILLNGKHNSDGEYNNIIHGLMNGTTYYYRHYIRQGTQCSYGSIRNFTTETFSASLSVVENSLTQTKVSIKGIFTGATEIKANAIEIGILYSSQSSDIENGGGTKLIASEISSDGEAMFDLSGLNFDTHYYYRYYITQDGVCTLGDVMNFKTENVPVTIAVESIDKNVVTFKGNVQFSEPGVIGIGVQYYPKSATSPKRWGVTEISDNGDFSLEISKLLYSTEYYWQYYLRKNDLLVTGQLQTFSINDIYEAPSNLNMGFATDLSSTESANCYIISKAGLYKFKTVKGNSTESVGSVVSASILWETYGTSTAPKCCDLIDAFCYKDGYIVFQTPEIFKEGNAVIAAKDLFGKILWSWHIWLTDEPEEQVYYNNAGAMMDRNLGATSTTPGDIVARGLLYQWGRKDPFLGSQAKSTITWPSSVSSDSSTGTIDYVTVHPTTFITFNSSNYDWYFTGSSSTDNTRWTTSENSKSIYDPCPSGWRVPDGGEKGVWAVSLGSSSSLYDLSLYSSVNAGINFYNYFGSDQIIWYPASGYGDRYNGQIKNVDYHGYYWSASSLSRNALYLSFDSNGDVRLSLSANRANAYSVRCLKK